jgi:peroxiredoxin
VFHCAFCGEVKIEKMKKWLILAMLYIPSLLVAQSRYTITGTIIDHPLKNVYFLSYYGERNFVIDSAKTDASGKFTLQVNGSTPPGMYKVSFGKDLYVDVIFNREDIAFTTDIRALADSLKFQASEENRLYYDFMKRDQEAQSKLELMQPVLDFFPDRDGYYKYTAQEYERIQRESAQSLDTLKRNHSLSYAVRIIRLYSTPFLSATLGRDERMAFLRQHYFDATDFTDTSLLRSPAYANKAISYLALYSNNRLQQKQLEAEFIKGVTVVLSAASVNAEVYKFLLDYLVGGFDKYHFEDVITYMAENFTDPSSCEDADKKSALQKKLETYKKIATGKPAPDLELPDAKGLPVKLSAMKSDYTLLVFYSSECGHCQEMLPKVKTLYDNQKPKRIEILAVSLDTDRQSWLDFTKAGKFGWINVCDLKGFGSPAADAYNIYATPTMFLLDRSKTILAKPISYRELEQVLRENGLL